MLAATLSVGFLMAHLSVHADPKVRMDVPYAGNENPRQTLDIYSPANAKEAPMVFWIHGGGWQAGSKKDVQLKPLAFTQKGFVFVSVNYRLLPEAQTIHQMAGDLAKALRWVCDHSGEMGVNGREIFVMGHSAGAQLAALICTDDRYLKAEKLSFEILKGCVPVDGDTYDVPMQIGMVEERRATSYKKKFGDEKTQKELSPITHVSREKGIPPFLILHVAEHPETKAQSQKLAKALNDAGVQANAYPATGKNHTSINNDLGSEGDMPTTELFGFVHKALKK
jgi:arylformamidase